MLGYLSSYATEMKSVQETLPKEEGEFKSD
jgi:hypothetical protein